MGRNKNSRKVRSGNKRLKKQKKILNALHAIQLVTVVAMCKCTIGLITATKFKKAGRISEAKNTIENEIILPLKETTDALNTYNAEKRAKSTK